MATKINMGGYNTGKSAFEIYPTNGGEVVISLIGARGGYVEIRWLPADVALKVAEALAIAAEEARSAP